MDLGFGVGFAFDVGHKTLGYFILIYHLDLEYYFVSVCHIAFHSFILTILCVLSYFIGDKDEDEAFPF